MDYNDFYKIGKIGKPHGVKGEVSFMFDDDVFDRTDADWLMLSVDGILVPFFLEEYRFKSNETALVKFCDVDTQDEARELTGCDVFFPRHLADEDEGHLSWAQIVGYTLVDAATGRVVGEIESVDDSTMNLLFQVRTADGDEVLVPEPSYVSYAPCITFAGGTAVPVRTRAEDCFALTPEALAALLDAFRSGELQ